MSGQAAWTPVSDFVARWIQQDSESAPLLRTVLTQGAAMGRVYLAQVRSKQEQDLQCTLDKYTLPDELAPLPRLAAAPPSLAGHRAFYAQPLMDTASARLGSMQSRNFFCLNSGVPARQLPRPSPGDALCPSPGIVFQPEGGLHRGQQ